MLNTKSVLFPVSRLFFVLLTGLLFPLHHILDLFLSVSFLAFPSLCLTLSVCFFLCCVQRLRHTMPLLQVYLSGDLEHRRMCCGFCARASPMRRIFLPKQSEEIRTKCQRHEVEKQRHGKDIIGGEEKENEKEKGKGKRRGEER